ncbi:MAG: hypothetical protein JW709_13755 [Sedimentisphaerales bacterium]|nr:hypothetical protein [Sedimentisphaerales bacterium]
MKIDRQSCAVGVLLVACILLGFGCANYVTPGPGANMLAMAETEGIQINSKDTLIDDYTIKDSFKRVPLAKFPAHIAIVRIQAGGYRSYTSTGYGTGRFSVLTGHDIETDADFERISNMAMVAAAAPLNRMVIPPVIDSVTELRRAAAVVQADMLLAYTIDTQFNVKDHDIGPLGVITLGFLPNQEAHVTSTASAIIFDVRTGYVFGLAETTARETQMASIWSSAEAVDQSRVKAETKAFQNLLGELEKTWKGILETHVNNPTVK